MNLLKNAITRVMVALAAIALVAGCEESGREEARPTSGPNLQLEVENITARSAKIKVSHTQEADLTWCGFLTDQVNEAEATLVARFVAEEDFQKALHRSRQYVTILNDLRPKTAYKYIAVGLTEAGEVYGTIASVEFSTLPGDQGDEPEEINGMRRNDAWTVRYIGEGTVSGKEYDHVVTMGSVDANPYTVTIVYAQQYDPADLRGLADLCLADMQNYLDGYNDYNGTEYTLADMLSTGDDVYTFDLSPGLYRAVALGYTKQGEVSGLYAVSEEFEVEVPEASAAYNEWLGEWTILGMNKATCNITLRAGSPNESFYMTGWEGYDDLEVEVEYNEDLNSIFFYAQLVREDYYLDEAHPSVDIYFLAGDAEEFYSIEEGWFYISIGGILDDGQRMIVRYGVNTPDYPRFDQMFLMAYVEQEQKYYGLSAVEEIPSFLALMSPPESPTMTRRAITPYAKREFKHPVLHENPRQKVR